ncbi:hypothetical protein BCY86_02770 [Pajaroellobacter abortibovis]|uniref:Uncharacterized protein n=1 Tax=Pajaroellobacter abortibovis TaxID=1882918 RepID=A0A1L6MVZ0_9BACT|nr:hypothetical protein BCY86_02770 [Pajaroellobacter abortibovis]
MSPPIESLAITTGMLHMQGSQKHLQYIYTAFNGWKELTSKRGFSKPWQIDCNWTQCSEDNPSS